VQATLVGVVPSALATAQAMAPATTPVLHAVALLALALAAQGPVVPGCRAPEVAVSPAARSAAVVGTVTAPAWAPAWAPASAPATQPVPRVVASRALALAALGLAALGCQGQVGARSPALLGAAPGTVVVLVAALALAVR